ncbi:MAG: LapA family protein [Prochloraceae cyanobacterium]|nr:LapA family protein [Prochloraceae cyanobacterium]
MQRILLLLGLTLFAIAIVQNSQPIAVVFFGFKIPWELPLSIWIFLFIAAGALTSLLLQLINSTSVPTSTKTRSQKSYSPPAPPPPSQPEAEFRSAPKPEREFPKRKPITEPFATAPPNPQETVSNSTDAIEDDILEQDKEWDIVEPPSEPTRVEQPDPTVARSQSTVFEAPQELKNVSRSGSIYSYTYRKSESKPKSEPQTIDIKATSSENPPDPDLGKTKIPSETLRKEYKPPQPRDRIYDAQYRVITPPYRDLPYEPLNDDEDDADWIE